MLIPILLFAMCLPAHTNLQRPHLTIGQGRVESNLNPKAKGKHGEKGAWQVREKYWGKVRRDLLSQAKQHERIINELLEENHQNLNTAVSRYNGYGRRADTYVSKVRVATLELLLLEP